MVWQAIFNALSIPAIVLPSPSSVILVIIHKASLLLNYTLITAYETIVGFVLGSIIAVAIAMILSLSAKASSALFPIILFFQSVPKIAIAPLLIIWLGFGIMPKVAIAILVSFFPVVVNMVAGLNDIPPEILILARSFSSRKLDTLLRVRFPSSMPYLFAGLKVAVTLAVIGAIVGEFAASTGGLGYLILVSSQELDPALGFASLVVLTIFAIVLYGAVGLAERFFVRWHVSMREISAGREVG